MTIFFVRADDFLVQDKNESMLIMRVRRDLFLEVTHEIANFDINLRDGQSLYYLFKVLVGLFN